VNQHRLFSLESKIWTVTDLNGYLRELLEKDYRLQDLWVSGEVSNLSVPSSGHMYFTLKDDESTLRCVMWRHDVVNQLHKVRDGDAVEVHGRISVYEIGGLYQLYADRIRPAGAGELFQRFLRLKEKLEAEGLFDPERKRELPGWPQRVGVVTSPTSAALRDVRTVLQRRYPLVEVVLAPTPVQGAEAPAGIVEALHALQAHAQPDVILLVRGGGSMEDLWAFNDEAVVRAVAASEIPVISGVGHATDLILTDFAADRHAPTPSAAAELAVPDRTELLMDLKELQARRLHSFHAQLQGFRKTLDAQRTALARVSPRAKVTDAQQQVDDLIQRATAAVHHNLALKASRMEGLIETLLAVSPKTVLERGFALVRRVEDGALVRSIKQVEMGDSLRIQVSDGEFCAEVKGETAED
jgi:exodeoxyribonuclease VII large subunit